MNTKSDSEIPCIAFAFQGTEIRATIRMCVTTNGYRVDFYTYDDHAEAQVTVGARSLHFDTKRDAILYTVYARQRLQKMGLKPITLGG